MQTEPLIYGDEVTAMLFAIADVNENIWKIKRLLEEEHGGEEGLPEDDA